MTENDVKGEADEGKPEKGKQSENGNVDAARRCQICQAQKARYRCPRCNVSTCSLQCCRIHKGRAQCDGRPHRSRFVPVSKYDSAVLLADINFLKEAFELRETCRIKESPFSGQRDRKKVNQLVNECRRRKIRLTVLPPSFQKSSNNTSFFNSIAETIFWRIEWILSGAEEHKVCTDRIPGGVTVATLLAKLLKGKLDDVLPEKSDLLLPYAQVPASDVHCLMKVEGSHWTKDTRYYLLNPSLSIEANLKGRILVEFPTVYVVLTKDLPQFPLLTDKEMLEVLRPKIWESTPVQRSVDEIFALMESIWQKWMSSSAKPRHGSQSQPVEQQSQGSQEVEEGEIVDELERTGANPLKRMFPLSRHQKARLKARPTNKKFKKNRKQIIDDFAKQLVEQQARQKPADEQPVVRASDKRPPFSDQEAHLPERSVPKRPKTVAQKPAMARDYFGLLGDITVSSDSDCES